MKETKAERRERIKRNRRKMVVDGKNIFELQMLILNNKPKKKRIG